ncbi:MAG: 16S rRNA (cytosine(1402)-N(4))-methyltransferase RsmH [Planctomycetota bacterium]|nr:16S rRNA (cytosine(1402)-N(4))-methyltransferase RsmH [Planctomycetota bacterium]
MTPGPDDLFHFHEPVLVSEVLEHLLADGPATAGLIVDGTVGAGGHAAAVLEAAPATTLLGLDRDPVALELATKRLAPFGDRATVLHASYASMGELLATRGLPAPTGILLDVGVSSMQLDDPERGFSFRADEAIPDMRFDPGSDDPRAIDLVNHADEKELARILFEYGEEPRARAVARAIVRARPLTTVGALREVVRRHALRVRRHDPATRTFQGLRIAVNRELEVLRAGLAAALDALAAGGRLVVLCFHSGEERCVKDAFREAKRAGHGRVLTKKPVRATEAEVKRNPRARPARLRAFERGPA